MRYTTDIQHFLVEQKTRASKYFKSNKVKLDSFQSCTHFTDWYIKKIQEQDNKCHYCEISIFDYRRLINSDIIKGRRVRGEGLRGPNLEIDRMNPNGIYTSENCVLSCYYCNNDKSNTFDYQTYLNTIGPSRKIAIQKLLSRL